MRVVVGAVVIRDGLVLATRRTKPAELAGQWEFPGGKVEDDEDPQRALIREFEEELGAAISIVAEVTGPDAPWRISDRHTLQLFLATLDAGDPVLGEDHDRLLWLSADDLDSVDWLPSDRRALDTVRRSIAELDQGS